MTVLSQIEWDNNYCEILCSRKVYDLSYSKSILNEYVKLSESSNTESATIHASMKGIVATINPKKEYEAFIGVYQ